MNTNEDHNWKFAQCFGDKGESDDITEGKVQGKKSPSDKKTKDDVPIVGRPRGVMDL